MTKNITALVPTTIGEAQSLAKVYAVSSLLPQELRNKPADVFVTIMAGMELGIAPMAALRNIHIIKGKPVLSADGMVACALAAGHCEYFRCIDSTGKLATYETKRRGSEPVRRSFTLDDAQRAGLLSNGTWKKYPGAMLRARCKADLARDVYPDAVAGVYETGEAESFEPAPSPEPEPEAIDAEVVDQEHAEMIEMCETEEQIASLVPMLEQLPKGEYRNEMRGLFLAKRSELREAAAA